MNLVNEIKTSAGAIKKRIKKVRRRVRKQTRIGLLRKIFSIKRGNN